MTGRVDSAVILAGGLGTRLRSAVPDLPKPMAPVAGRPFLEHQLDYWIGQGVHRFVLAVGYRHESIVGHFGGAYRGAAVEYAVEASPRGTGGGLLLAVEKLAADERFLVLNGDTFFAVDLRALAAFAYDRDADWCFALFRSADTARFLGVSLSADGRLMDLATQEGGAGRLVNGGVYLVHPRVLPVGGLAEDRSLSLEAQVFPDALAGGRRLFGLAFEGDFIDIGVPGDFRRAEDVICPGGRRKR